MVGLFDSDKAARKLKMTGSRRKVHKFYIFKEKGTRKYGSAYLRAARKRQNMTNSKV